MTENLSNFEIRQLKTHQEYIACVALERKIWGQNFAECVPPAILMVSQKVGGVSAGAFDKSNHLAGFVFGLTGIKSGRPVHWSHMLAVRPEVRNMGLGKKLKLFQRSCVMKLGVETIYWTYDPLVAKNAHINLNLLGTKIDEYVPDMYISGNESDLHRGLGMDRFVVSWQLRGQTQKKHSDFPGKYGKLPVVNTELAGDGRGRPIELDLTEKPQLRIEIPDNIETIQSESLELAGKWRKNTREAFIYYLNKGYRIKAFYRDKSSERCYYVLELPIPTATKT